MGNHEQSFFSLKMVILNYTEGDSHLEMCLGLAVIFDVVNVWAQIGHTVCLCPAMTKGKEIGESENKANTAPGASREIPDYHSPGNKTKTAGSASHYNCFFLPS